MAFDYTMILGNAIYTLFFLMAIIFVLTRKVAVPELKRRFFTGKGYAWVRIVMPDRHEQEDFVNIKKEPLRVGGRSFLLDYSAVTFKSGGQVKMGRPPKKEKLDLKKMVEYDAEGKLKLKAETPVKGAVDSYILDIEATTTRGKYPVFTFRYDKSEPIDFFALEKKVDSTKFDLMIKRALAQKNLKDVLGGNKRLMLYIMIAAALIAAAAYFSFENNSILKDIVARGVGLGG